MLKIVADDAIPYLEGVLDPYAEVTYLPGDWISRKAVADADALLVRTRTRCDRNLLEGSRVKMIATATIGYDHIDTAFCLNAGIAWANAPGCNSGSVSQYMAAALLRMITDKELSPENLTLGIIGAGHVGSKVEKLARLLGMKILLNDPPRERMEGPGLFTPLEMVLENSDIVTLHVPLNCGGPDNTLHLIGPEAFSHLRDGCWLINTSRGEVIHQETLLKAMRSQRVAGAILDVWENEPHPDPELLAAAYLATPHIAGYSADGKAGGTAQAVQALARFFGLPLTGWIPSSVPLPENPVIRPECCSGTQSMILEELVRTTYDIASDDQKFRQDPSSFEAQRKHYPARREFHAYTVELPPGNDHLLAVLEQLGFSARFCR